MSAVITGLFANPADASASIHTLEARGVQVERISIIAGDTVDANSFAITTHSKLPEGVALGAGTGGAIGALIAGFVAAGTIVTGGVGLIAVGPLIASLAGAGAGATAGGIVGGSIGSIIPEHEVKHYEDAFKKGSVLVGVECTDDDTEDAVRDTFKNFDAKKVSTA